MITAIIPHYFEEREENLRRIVSSYKTTGVSEVIIWDNTGSLVMSDAIVINSPRNIGCRGRFLAALTATNDVLLFQDNDLLLEQHAIEHMLSRLNNNIVTLDGRKFYDDKLYTNSEHVVRPDYDRLVHISLARAEMMDKNTFISVFITQYFDQMEMDDIWLSWLANTLSIDIIVPAHKEGCGFINLDEKGVGASAKPNHYETRNELCKRLFK